VFPTDPFRPTPVGKSLNNIYNFGILRGVPPVSEIICYCFGYSAEDIKKDYTENGRSTILERIIVEKKKGNCRCEQTNPEKNDVLTIFARW